MHRAGWLLLLLTSGVAAQRPTLRVDFDALAPGPTRGEPILLRDVDGRGLEVRFEGPELQVIDLFEFAHDPSVRGRALITWSWPQQDGITITFSRPITYVSARAGDFGGDDDGPLTLRAYDCDGSEVAAANAPWPSDALPPFRQLEVRGAAICRVKFTSGGQHAGSAFLDDLEFTLAQ